MPRSVGLVVTNAIMNASNPVGNRSVAVAFDASGTRIGEWVIDDLPLSIIQSSLEWRPYHFLLALQGRRLTPTVTFLSRTLSNITV